MGDWGSYILIAGALLAGVGAVFSIAIANKLVQWIANLAALAGVAGIAAGLFLMGVASILTWILLAGGAVIVGWILYRARNTGVDAWLANILTRKTP